MFTSKLVLCQYCKLFFKAMYAHEILAFTGFLAGVRNRSTTCYACSVGLFSGRIEAVRRN